MMLKYILFSCLLSISSGVFAQSDSVCTYVDVPAHFPGDSKSLHLWIIENLTYPDSLRLNEHFVTHFSVSFIVETDGRLTEIRVIQPDDIAWNRHVAGVIKSMPRWVPGKVEGVNVRSKVHLPIILCPE